MPSASDILSDPEIATAYEDVRSDKSETTWLVLKYESPTKDNVILGAKGTGDITEMCEQLGDDEGVYGYIRMKLGNDEYSERVKFVFVVWTGRIDGSGRPGKKLTLGFTGPKMKVMRKAKMSFQSGQVKQVIRTYAVEIQTDSKRDLAEDAVTLKLRKAMGANYDRQSSAY